jgi:hypothetical protein
MKELATTVTYNSFGRLVTIRFRDGVEVIMPSQDAVRLGDQLIRLIRPIDLVACDEAAV